MFFNVSFKIMGSKFLIGTKLRVLDRKPENGLHPFLGLRDATQRENIVPQTAVIPKATEKSSSEQTKLGDSTANK